MEMCPFQLKFGTGIFNQQLLAMTELRQEVSELMSSMTIYLLKNEEWKAPFETEDDTEEMDVVLEFTETVSDDKVLEIVFCSVEEDSALPLGIERSRAPGTMLMSTVNRLKNIEQLD
jgi:hypothetical protein